MLKLVAKFEKAEKLTTKTNLVFSTKAELDSLVIEQLKDSTGHLLFSIDEIKRVVEVLMKDRRIGVDRNGRSPSQKFRATLTTIAIKQGKDPEQYYIEAMNKLDEHYRKKYL